SKYQPGTDVEQAMDGPVKPAVDQLLTFIAEERAVKDMDETHEYTAKGILYIGEALQAITERENVAIDSEEKLSQLSEIVDYIQNDSRATSDSVRSSFLLLTQWMHRLQEEAFANLEPQVQQAYERALAVTAEEPVLNQKEEVQMFFNAATFVVRNMAYREDEFPIF
ncbi:MAG: hypothetical protein ACK4ND_11960, partial [Cytophagaceae bacterium]